MIKLFAAVQMTDTDRRALIILLIILVLLVLLLGLFGMAVRAVMKHQAKRADTMMHDVAVTHIVNTPKSFRHFGLRKSNRALYRDSLWPFLIAAAGFAVWIINNIATGNWGENPFAHFGDLFFHFLTDNSQYPADDPLWVKVFGMTIIARWPEVEAGFPCFRLEHLCSYIEVALWIVAGAWYAYACQAWIARFVRIQRRSHTVFEKSLEGFNANVEVDITPENPLPPSE